ncbi:MAG: cell division protein FtsA [Candidatus Berkelbacteria bacterium Gr01-1014_85]|uniref:Cell division protein FtsA n=1 Tax=Candidatus Berkelbacteria bacterium Gr01-1014_85 TaxID=2017150 RepID=A0A554J981_9BACT|nr:MAG: cell division protein FtsA [Candidatus Berkelbacteria bacterium Gr01-1014_85]
MSQSKLVVGIDIGSSKVAVTVGQLQEEMLHVIGVGQAANHGVRKGVISDLDETASALTTALDQAEQMSGQAIHQAFFSVNGPHIVASQSKGVIAISRADGVVTEADTERVVGESRAIAMPPNRELLHCRPRYYSVDGQEPVKDPVGMSGVRLEVETLVVGCATHALRNLDKVAYQANVQVSDHIYSPLATIRYGTALPESIRESEKIDLTEIDPAENSRQSKRFVAEIIEARLNEIFVTLEDELKAIDRDSRLPAGVILTGGGSKLEGLIEYTKNTLRLPVSAGQLPLEISGLVDKIDDPSLSTCIGLLLWGIFESSPTIGSTKSLPDLGGLNNLGDKARGFFRQFIP